MLRCSFSLMGISPLGFSAPLQSVKKTGENHDDFEKRTWRERLHTNCQGQVFIPPMALKNMLAATAKYLSETVAGKGKATYTKHFEAGIMVVDPLIVCGPNGKPIIGKNVEGLNLFVPSDGKKGGGSRVWKTFPIIPQWQADGEVIVLDPVLIGRPEKIHDYLGHGGQFVGLLFFRPRNGGYYGRFTVENWKVVDTAKAAVAQESMQD